MFLLRFAPKKCIAIVFIEALTIKELAYSLRLILQQVGDILKTTYVIFSAVLLSTLLFIVPVCADISINDMSPKLVDTSVDKTMDTTAEYTKKYPYIFHLVQKEAWEKAIATNTTYYPPTYQQDEFTHATANPDFLLIIGNHFYKSVEGDWLCLRMSVDTLKATGVETIFEGTAPVGDQQADFPGTDSELFPHILGGIHPAAVMQAHEVSRAKDGTFLAVSEIIDGE